MTPSDLARLALTCCLLLAACDDGGGAAPDPAPMGDGGPADAGPPEVPIRVAVDAGPAAPSASAAGELASLPYASVGVRCVAGERRTFLVLSEAPPDCAAHAARLADGAASSPGLLPVALPPEAGGSPVTVTARGPVCAADGCLERAVTLDIEAFASPDALAGRFRFDGPAGPLGGPLAPVVCDYDAFVPPPGGDTPVRGLRVTGVSLNQAVDVPLGVDGPQADEGTGVEPVVVAGRPGLLRVFVEPIAGEWAPRDVIARLDLGGGDVREQVQRVSVASVDGDLASTFAFDLAAEDVTPDTTWSVGLFEVPACAETTGSAAGSRLPADGQARLGATEPEGALDVVIVPMRFTADGSNRLPDTSDAALAAYRDQMLRTYPVAEVSVSFREPVDLTVNVTRSANWSAFLFACRQLRSTDDVPDDTYYYCIANPAPTFRDYCTGGCIAGLGTLPSESDVSLRQSVGVGYAGVAESTFVHEIGHNHGRRHTPCGGPAGVDPDYPHAGASIGRWGWDIVDRRLLDPARARDFMSYCGPEWVSDYTFAALFERHRKVETAVLPAFAGLFRSWRTAIVEEGGLAWEGWTEPTPDGGGDPVVAEWLGPQGERRVLSATFARFDHVEGGFLSVEDFGVAPGTGVVRVPQVGTIPW